MTAAPPTAKDPGAYAGAFRWIERELGGQVVRHERHPRWRPAFDIDLERPGGEVVPVHFRGDRGHEQTGDYGTEHEFKVLQVLEAHGIRVPHIYGLCEDPLGIVMERAPGRPNLATAESEDERQDVLDEYIDQLVAMHAIDPGAFEAVGIPRPADGEALVWGDYAEWVGAYREHKPGPEPLIEFALAWLGRNAPSDRAEVTFCHGDAGQFIFEDGRLTALLDFEFGYLGDPAADLGALRSRDLSEPLGDLNRAYRRYHERSGRPIDPRVLDFHTVRFALETPLSTCARAARPDPSLEPVQFLGWYLVYGRCALEVIAHAEGVALEAPPLPEPEPTRQATAHDALVEMLATLPARDAFADYRVDAAARLAQYLQRAERYGPALEADDLEEVAKLLGHRPGSWREADAALEALVESAPRERDPELIRCLHRRTLRREALLEPVLRELRGARMQLAELA